MIQSPYLKKFLTACFCFHCLSGSGSSLANAFFGMSYFILDLKKSFQRFRKFFGLNLGYVGIYN